MIYVCLDKVTKQPKGMVQIDNLKVKDEWDKTHILIEVDDSFIGKLSYEIKYENDKVRLATQVEIDIYKAQEDARIKDEAKARTLTDLGLTQEDIDKVKAIK